MAIGFIMMIVSFILLYVFCFCRGGYSRPKITSILWLQLILLPYHTFMYIKWYIQWIWKFRIQKMEYGDEEKHYLIRKFMSLSQSQWDVSDQPVLILYLSIYQFKPWPIAHSPFFVLYRSQKTSEWTSDFLSVCFVHDLIFYHRLKIILHLRFFIRVAFGAYTQLYIRVIVL